MAYRIEKGTGDIVIDGWEQGVADAPELGITFMRNLNLISIPGEGCVNYQTTVTNTPPVINAAPVTFNSGTDVITWGNILPFYNGVAVTFDATTGGVTAGTVYWVGNVSGATFKIYTNIARDQLVDLTANSTPNMSTITMGQPTHKALDVVGTATSPNNVFILDVNGRAWWVNTSGNVEFLGNTTLTGAHGNGMCVFGAFLYVMRDSFIDYLPIDAVTNSSATASQWSYGWQALTAPPSSIGYSHYAIAAQDNAMYICNNQTIASVLAKSGQTTVDPSNSATYTYNASALLLPSIDRATCLAELGINLLVGGLLNKIYPWDRVSTSYAYPIVVSENYTYRMVTTNSSTYVFAGNRGRIFVTNGANIQLFKKIPDHIVGIFGASNGPDPYFTWLDAIFWKNQIYFSFLANKNDGTAITNIGGVWALDVSMNVIGNPTSVALRMTNTLAGGAALFPYVIAPNIRSSTPSGAGLYIAWSNINTPSYGVDITASTPYSDFTGGIGGEIYTDLIPSGILLNSRTFSQIEFKLAEQLVSGESVRISARQSYSDAFVVQGTFNTTGTLSDYCTINLEGVDTAGNSKGQWIQLYIELQAAASSPSFVRLKEVRLR